VFRFRTPPPDVSAAGAEWQINGEPIVVAGLTYYPTRGFRLFDGQVMAQTGSYERVPVYADTTLEPYREVYIPLGSGRMRIYERGPDLEFAPSNRIGETMPLTQSPAFTDRAPCVPCTPTSALPSDRDRMRHISIITPVPHDDSANGVWLEYNGARWYSNGPAAVFSADRFEPIGTYRGFLVYRDKIMGNDELWVSVVKDGPLAPYRRR